MRIADVNVARPGGGRLKGAFVLAAVVAVVAAGAVSIADARPVQSPTVLLGTAAALAPDSRSVTLDVVAGCPERWTVVDARVSFAQPQASGEGSFPLTCTGSVRSFRILVPSSGAAFQLGEARATATVVIQRGRTQQAQDTQTISVQASVDVALPATARVQGSGLAVTIDITVACPVGARGLESYVNVSQGQQVFGTGFYTPTCDGQSHTLSVLVPATQGLFQPGAGSALTFAVVEAEGQSSTGVAENTQLQLVAG
jgi:hypothetical protein